MSSGIADLPKPVLGAAYDSVLALKVAVFKHYLEQQAEPTILSSDYCGARLRCRLHSDSTSDKVGEGTPCAYLIKAGRANPSSALRITEFESSHSCPASARQERNHSETSVGQSYTRGKLENLVRSLEAEKRREHEAAQPAQTSEQEGETPTLGLNANGRPIRSSAQDVNYTFAPSLLPVRASSATARSSVSSSSKRIASDAPIPGKRPKLKSLRLSAPTSTAASASRSVSSHKSRLSDLTASRRVTSHSGALDRTPLPAKPLRTGGPSTVFLQKTPKQTNLASTPSAPPLKTSHFAKFGPIRQFLATTSLIPTQRDVLARARESAGVLETEDLVKILFLNDDILTFFGGKLLVSGADSWPADSRFRTINEALQAVVRGARVEANFGERS